MPNNQIKSLTIGGVTYDIVDRTSGYVSSSTIGAASGIAPLNASSKIDSTYLPSYVDDVVEGYYYNGNFYEESTHTTLITGEAGKIYVDLSTDGTYRYSGSTFVEIGSGGSVVTISRNLTSGTKSATINVNGTDYDIYSVSNTDEKVKLNLTTSGNSYGIILTSDSINKTNPETQYYDPSISFYTTAASGKLNGSAALTIGSSTQQGNVCLFNADVGSTTLVGYNASSDRTISFPDKSGTIALTSDIPTVPTISLNGSSTASASFYAPTTAGTSGYVLTSSGSGAPTWSSAVLTDEKLKVGDTAIDGTGYFVLSSNNTSTASTKSIDTTGLSYTVQNGTTEESGYSMLTLGNSTIEGVANNKAGVIKIYGPSSGYVQITAPSLGSSNSTVVSLPTGSGTLALWSDITDEKVKYTASTSSLTYYPLVATSTAFTSAVNTLNGINFYQYYNTAGGYRRLNLGNTTAWTSTGGAYGTIRLYGAGATYYGDLVPGVLGTTSGDGHISANRTWTLPDKTGTIALTSDIPTVPTITLNGSSTTSPSFYAPTTAGTSGQVLTSNGSGAPTWAAAPSGSSTQIVTWTES